MKNIFRLSSRRAGFTLIELIVVVAIIALLAASAFVAINPGKRVGNAADAKRWADITAIADAISHYAVDYNGALPSGVSSAAVDTEYVIRIAGGANSNTEACASTGEATDAKLDISSGIVPGYIPTMPLDPDITSLAAESDGIGYYIIKDSAGRVKVGACNESAYATASIYVQR